MSRYQKARRIALAVTFGLPLAFAVWLTAWLWEAMAHVGHPYIEEAEARHG